MQPTYFPWLGYFDLISRADIFVFLDDVQFSYRSWQHRNRIVNRGKETMLTVPVINKGGRKRIKDILIDESQTGEKNISTVLKKHIEIQNITKCMLNFLRDSSSKSQ